MIVVEVQDDRVERQPLLAALRALLGDVLEAVEQALQPRPDGVRVARQCVRALVRRPERARSAEIVELLAERLVRAAPRAFGDRVSQLDLIVAR